jgi:hypothetical protein
VGVLELTALPTIAPERWMPWVREADALLVDGGEAVYLAEWIRRSGLADLLPELHETVWVGISAGSMALTPRVGPEFVDRHPGGTDGRWGWSTSRSSRTWTTRAGPETRPQRPTGGRRASAAVPTRSTTRRRSVSSTARST